MTLQHITFLIVFIGLIALVCIPLDGALAKITRIAVLVAGVLWVILDLFGAVPLK